MHIWTFAPPSPLDFKHLESRDMDCSFCIPMPSTAPLTLVGTLQMFIEWIWSPVINGSVWDAPLEGHRQLQDCTFLRWSTIPVCSGLRMLNFRTFSAKIRKMLGKLRWLITLACPSLIQIMAFVENGCICKVSWCQWVRLLWQKRTLGLPTSQLCKTLRMSAGI